MMLRCLLLVLVLVPALVSGTVLWNGNFDSTYYTDSNSLNTWSWATPVNSAAAWKCYIAGGTQPGSMSHYVDLSSSFANTGIYNQGLTNKLGARFQMNTSTTWGGNVRTGLVANYDFAGIVDGTIRYFQFSLKTPSSAPLSSSRIHQLVFFENALFMLQLGSFSSGPDNTLRFLMPSGEQNALWSGTFTADVWHNFVVKIKFSSSGNGMVDMWYSQGANYLQESSTSQHVIVARTVPAPINSNEYHHEVYLPGSNGATVANEIVYFDGSIIADAASDVFANSPPAASTGIHAGSSTGSSHKSSSTGSHKSSSTGSFKSSSASSRMSSTGSHKSSSTGAHKSSSTGSHKSSSTASSHKSSSTGSHKSSSTGAHKSSSTGSHKSSSTASSHKSSSTGTHKSSSSTGSHKSSSSSSTGSSHRSSSTAGLHKSSSTGIRRLSSSSTGRALADETNTIPNSDTDLTNTNRGGDDENTGGDDETSTGGDDTSTGDTVITDDTNTGDTIEETTSTGTQQANTGTSIVAPGSSLTADASTADTTTGATDGTGGTTTIGGASSTTRPSWFVLVAMVAAAIAAL